MEFNKNTLLFDSFRNQFHLIDVEKQYPVNDMQDITLSLDVIVMKTEEYVNLLKKAERSYEQ
jgi:hypothetical protein